MAPAAQQQAVDDDDDGSSLVVVDADIVSAASMALLFSLDYSHCCASPSRVVYRRCARIFLHMRPAIAAPSVRKAIYHHRGMLCVYIYTYMMCVRGKRYYSAAAVKYSENFPFDMIDRSSAKKIRMKGGWWLLLIPMDLEIDFPEIGINGSIYISWSEGRGFN